INDLVKEFGIRMTEPKMLDNIKELSPETQKLYENFKQGKATSSDMFKATIGDLQQVQDNPKQTELGKAIFGTIFEDMGNVVVLGLTNVNGAHVDVDGSMKNMQKIQREGFGVRCEKLVRTTRASSVPLGKAIIDSAEVALPP
ncbi:phage tail tape measure protein, partial [Bacillus paranthracis]|nr:phage tail tape measure protein [Bacillus paranthracis]